ncbi:Uncharacterised protein [Vibrio cholerae]|nr:Uncharacterised protein [Vibrio cholerae]CSC99475.1 Uncharacterised protein [Vibrio cholerae]
MVVSRIGVFGERCLICFMSGVTARVSPTDAAWIQIGGVVVFSGGVMPKCSFQRFPTLGFPCLRR